MKTSVVCFLIQSTNTNIIQHMDPRTCWEVARGHHANLCCAMYCIFLIHGNPCVNTDFVVSTNIINMFNFIDIYSFIPASDCVGMGPSTLLCPGAYNAVKTTLGHLSDLIYCVIFSNISAISWRLHLSVHGFH